MAPVLCPRDPVANLAWPGSWAMANQSLFPSAFWTKRPNSVAYGLLVAGWVSSLDQWTTSWVCGVSTNISHQYVSFFVFCS